MSRWPQLKVPKSKIGIRTESQETASKYFKELENVMEKYGLKNKLGHIYNVDEKGNHQNKPGNIYNVDEKGVNLNN